MAMKHLSLIGDIARACGNQQHRMLYGDFVKNRFKITLVVLSLFMFYITFSYAEERNKKWSDETVKKFENEKAILHQQANRGGVAGIKEYVDSLQSSVSQPAESVYRLGALNLEASNILVSKDFGDPTQYTLAYRYASIVLEDPDRFSLEVELGLVSHIKLRFNDPRMLNHGTWQNIRKAQMKAWFHAYRRLHQSIDPNWDRSKIDFEQVVSPPEGVKSRMASVPIDSIEDPELRKIYAEAVENNKRKIEKYNEQCEFVRLRDIFDPQFNLYVISSYSTKPFVLNELEDNMTRYAVEEKVRDAILKTVNENIKSARLEEEKVKNNGATPDLRRNVRE